MMSRKTLFLIPLIICIALCMTMLTGCESSKAKKQAAQFMNEKYGEEFTVEEASKHISWYAYLRSDEHPEYRIQARYDLNRPETLMDDYVQQCVYGRFSKDVFSIIKTYFPHGYVRTTNAYDEYIDFGSNTNMSIQEMNKRCPNMGITIYIEKSDFSLQKAYNAMLAVREAYSDLDGDIVVIVIKDGKMKKVKENIYNNDYVKKQMIGSSQFAVIPLQGQPPSFGTFSKEFNDWGGVFEEKK